MKSPTVLRLFAARVTPDKAAAAAAEQHQQQQQSQQQQQQQQQSQQQQQQQGQILSPSDAFPHRVSHPHPSSAPTFGFPELVAAATMLAPSLLALLLTPDDETLQADLMSLGAVLHCPFSMMLHIHRAYGRCAHTRGVLHRLDVSFIHVHAMMTNLAWRADLGTYEAVGVLLNVASIIALFTSCHAKNQVNAPLRTAACVVWSAAYIFVLNQVLGICAYLGWALAFGVFFLKPCGIYTPAVFHLLLALPQACVVKSVVG